MSPLLERALLAVLGLASFASTAGAVRASLAAPALAENYEKLAYLEREGANYTALIVGSSAIYRGLDPRVLDDAVAAGGVDGFRSFNLAARSMRGFEADYLLRRAVDAIGPSLRWIVMEPQSWFPAAEKSALGTEREDEWHDLVQTLGVISVVRDPYFTDEERPKWILYHARIFARRLSNVGTGARLVAGLTGDELPRYAGVEQIREMHGYLSIEDSALEHSDWRRARFLENEDAYLAAVEAQRGAPSVFVPARAMAEHRRQREWCETRGLELIYVMPPFSDGGCFARYMEEQGEADGLIDFVDPDRFPELFDIDARLDAQHLSAAGAASMSRTCGALVAELVRAREEARR